MWEIDQRGVRRHLSDDQVRNALRTGELTGRELARRDGERTWSPVVELPEFRGPLGLEVALSRSDGNLRAFLSHLGVFSVFVVFSGLTDFNGWAFLPWWGLGVALHGVSVATKWRRRERGVQQRAAEPKSDLGRRLERLTKDVKDPALRADLLDLQSKADALSGQRDQLGQLLSQDHSLESEAAEIEQALASTTDPRTKEALLQNRNALSTRLELLEKAKDAQVRLSAQQRTLEHQIEALRLALLQRGGENSGLQQQLDNVRALVDADDEVEALLASARLDSL